MIDNVIRMNSFKDLFSGHSQDYAKFRPTYPESLFRYLASLASEHEFAWDAGTGNGQAAVKVAQHFKFVVATDPSEKQLQSATSHPRVEYRAEPAEHSGLADHSIDLVTSAQAFHWFKADLFFAEAKRVLKPGAPLAFWCYGLTSVSADIDTLVLQLYEGVLGTYWEKERRLVDAHYRDVKISPNLFEEISAPEFEIEAQWTLDHLLGYLSTWSALHAFSKVHGYNPLETMVDDFKLAWGSKALLPVRWPIGLRVARANS